jgi:hypothetical protein
VLKPVIIVNLFGIVVVALKRAGCCLASKGGIELGTLSSDPSGQLDVLGHDGDPLGVDGAQVGVLEQADQVGHRRLLQLEPEV